MKITITESVFQVLARVEGNPELAQAKVLASAKDYAVLESTGEDAFTIKLKHDLGAILAGGQILQFNAAGEVQGDVKVVEPKVAKKPEKTGGASPAFQAPVTGRDGFVRRVD